MIPSLPRRPAAAAAALRGVAGDAGRLPRARRARAVDRDRRAAGQLDGDPHGEPENHPAERVRGKAPHARGVRRVLAALGGDVV